MAAVVFDEFHERSVDADLALALCREAQQVLRLLGLGLGLGVGVGVGVGVGLGVVLGVGVC